jgi:hypothetical protein
VLAALLGRQLDELSEIWAAEFERLFGLELPSGSRDIAPSDCPDPAAAAKRK